MDIRDKFEKMCESILVGGNGFFFPYEHMEFDDKLSDLYNDEDFTILKEKMDSLIILINKDSKLIESDIKEELWNLL